MTTHVVQNIPADSHHSVFLTTKKAVSSAAHRSGNRRPTALIYWLKRYDFFALIAEI